MHFKSPPPPMINQLKPSEKPSREDVKDFTNNGKGRKISDDHFSIWTEE
jgi:hypothetical protein